MIKKKLYKSLSSLHLTTWTLIILAFWFTWGILLADSEKFADGFNLMNSMLVRDWLILPQKGLFLLRFWFTGLCLIMVLLGVNLIFCTWTKFFKIIRKKFTGPRLFMLMVHILFGVVALGHLAGFMTGYRYEKIRLAKGEIFSFENGFKVKLNKIYFIDNPQVLKKARKEFTGKEFHYRLNYAEVTLSYQDKQLKTDRIYLLKPMQSHKIQITLNKFRLIACSGKKNNQKFDYSQTHISDHNFDHELFDEKLGVILTVTKNPVMGIFMITYALMIIGIFIHMIITWHRV